MASIKEVKAKAQDLVNKGKYDKAVILYTKIMEKLQEKGNPDIGLYNKVGDIYLGKLDNKELAIGNYTTAMTMYGKFGLYPNAIAMAKKIIKIDNTQIEMYEKIGEFNKAQGLIGEALNNFILFAERSIKNNDRKSAIRAFKETLDMMPGKVEIKEKLVDLYIQEENYDQAVELLKEVESHYIKMNSMEQAAMIRQKITRYIKRTSNPEPTPQPAPIPPLAEPEHNEDIEIDDFDMSDLVNDLTKELDSSFQEAEQTESPIPSYEEVKPKETIPDINIPKETESISEVEELETLSDDDDFSYENYVELAKLQEELDINEAVQSYYQGADGYLNINNYSNALRVYKRIVEIKPDELKAHKAIMDIAGKTGDHIIALHSYLFIADVYKTKDVSKTLKLLETVLSFDPNNKEAIQMKESILGKPEKETPKPVAKPKPVPKPKPVESSKPELGLTADDFLNEFKSEITEGLSENDILFEAEHVTAKDIVSGKNEGSNKPKFKIEDDKPTAKGGDVWSLNELLDELKEGLDETLSDDDVSSHYDLGVSFKEMGLFDMALDEFNKSVKNKDFEFKSLEMLSQCYLEKGDLNKAENILNKAFKIKGKDEIEYLGIKHTLAVLYDKKEMFEESLKLLKEVKAVEPSFRGIDKHMKYIEDAIASKNAKKVKAASKSKKSDEQYINFSEFLTDENIDESLSEIDNIEIDLDDDSEDTNKTKNISYM